MGLSAAAGTAVHSRHSIGYDLAGLVLSEKTATLQGADWIYTHTVNHYSADGTGPGFQPYISWSGQTGSSSGGLLYFSRTKNWKNGSKSPHYVDSDADNDFVDSDTRQTYEWRDAALQKTVALTNRHGSSTSTYTYDRDGALAGVGIAGGDRPRSIHFTNNLQGQVIGRSEYRSAPPYGDMPHSRTYMFGGRQTGTIGNDGTGNVDYAASIAERTAAPGSGPFRNGATSGAIHADFDANFTALNGSTVSEGPSGYTANAGETLQSIAAQLWGDSSLWYKLAEANPGLAPGAIAAGTSLRIPGGVIGNHHSADTFKPYDPAEAIGNTSPNTPKPPKKNNCGVFGQILLFVVAVAVTAILKAPVANLFAGLGKVGGAIATGATLGAVSNVASQGVGVAAGIQDRFNWGAVGMSALAGGISGGLSAGDGGSTLINGIKSEFLSNFVNGAAQAAIGGVLSQGFGVVTGLQSKFDFAGVAAGALGGGFNAAIKGTGFGADLARASADGVASAAARSLITGTSFGDNIIAVLPSVIGRTVGGMFERAVAGGRDTSGVPETRQASESASPPAGTNAGSELPPMSLYSPGLLERVAYEQGSGGEAKDITASGTSNPSPRDTSDTTEDLGEVVITWSPNFETRTVPYRITMREVMRDWSNYANARQYAYDLGLRFNPEKDARDLAGYKEAFRRAARNEKNSEAALAQVDMFFGGIVAAWMAPVTVPLLMKGGAATGIGGLALAADGNHFLGASAPFIGATKLPLDYLAGDGASAKLDIAAGGANLLYGGYHGIQWMRSLGAADNGVSLVRSDPFAGVKEASAYLKSMGVGRSDRVKILQSFEVGTVSVETAGDSLYGLRFHDFGENARPMGQYLFETFTSQTNRAGLALPPDWNGMTGIKQWQIAPGTTVLRGRTAPQLSYGDQYKGGAEQMFVLEPWKYGPLK